MSIFQSPIPLSSHVTKGQEGKQNLTFDKKVSRYAYDSENKIWIVGEPIPNLITNRQSFYLFEFHIHQRGEHPLNGKIYPLEFHAVFLNGKGYIVHLAYVADVAEESSTLF